jgi:hypothetical protein
MKAVLLTVLALVAFTGCAAAPPARKGAMPISTPFTDAAFAPWAGTGNASIEGEAFMRTIGGDVKTCAGQSVILMPNNPYSQQAFAYHVGKWYGTS